MNKHKVLVDLRIALNKGYCGIGQDSCLMFRSLADNAAVEANGFLYSSRSLTKPDSYHYTTSRAAAIEQSSWFFQRAFNRDTFDIKTTPILQTIKNRLTLLKNNFDLYPIDELFHEVIWRNIFSKYLEPKFRAAALKNPFYLSNLTEQHLNFASKKKREIKLNTPLHDFVIFPSLNTASVSPNSIKLVRYHDAIPILSPDLTLASSSLEHARLLEKCKQDSYFICNSDWTRDTLINLLPELENKTYVVPASTSYPYKKVNNRPTLNQIILSRLSDHILPNNKLDALRHKLKQTPDFDYILNVATLDPKKNITTLIHAWEKLTYSRDKNLKLVILANKGWLSHDAENSMRPHLESGRIIHLNSATSLELEYLYSHAKAFVFPSYTEGFGLPPLEAIQCECPTIVSDIPAHRWVLDDAVSYCDPYDANSIKDALVQLLYSEELSKNNIRKGLARAKLYSQDKLAEHWINLLDTIKSKHLPGHTL